MSNSPRMILDGLCPPRAATAPRVLSLRLLPLALLVAGLGSGTAMARPSDALHVYGSVGYFHDDNLFRLPDDAPGYDNQREDSGRQTVIGAFFDKTYGRQKVFLQLKRSKVKFEHFKQLDYNGKDYLGRLNWELGNHLEGSAGASYAQTLAPYTDLRTRERNLRIQRREFFDGSWRFHPSWRMRVGTQRDRFTYELPIQSINDREDTNSEIGVDYLPRTGSTAGLVARHIKGRYLKDRVFNGVRLDDDFTQDELKVKIDWRVTPISTVQVLAGRVKRKHEGVNRQRDSSGFNGRVTVSSVPRAKLRVNTAVFREYMPIESTIVSYALSRGAIASASWDATAKIRVEGSLSSERRAYETPFNLAGADLSDKIRRASLNATWSLQPTVQVSAGLSHENRDGSIFLGSGSYKANTVSLNANAQF
ncbi:MAG: XrtB/PEP-CTERM-associated polysaccharide biosynthesis outer membrane protein EpsL [Gammaproteobacteria bacterium]